MTTSDEIFFQRLDTEDFYQNINIQRVPLNYAEGIVCTGLFDDSIETPSDYTELLVTAKKRGLKMLCANPYLKQTLPPTNFIQWAF